jgi:hypothetical protein
VSQELSTTRRRRVVELLRALSHGTDHRAAILYELRQALDAYFIEREEIVSYGVRAVLGARVAALGQERARCCAAFARLVERRYEDFGPELNELTTYFSSLDEPVRHAA